MWRYSLIIKLRDSYMISLSSFKNMIGIGDRDNCWYLFQPIRPLRQTSELGYKYVYSLIGKIVEVDDVNDIITLECSNGKQYKMGVEIEPTDEPGWVQIYVGKNMNAEDPRANPFLFYEPDISRSAEKDKYYRKDDLYNFIWLDSRELTDIYRSIKTNPNDVVNLRDSIVVSIIR